MSFFCLPLTIVYNFGSKNIATTNIAILAAYNLELVYWYKSQSSVQTLVYIQYSVPHSGLNALHYYGEYKEALKKKLLLIKAERISYCVEVFHINYIIYFL